MRYRVESVRVRDKSVKSINTLDGNLGRVWVASECMTLMRLCLQVAQGRHPIHVVKPYTLYQNACAVELTPGLLL